MKSGKKGKKSQMRMRRNNMIGNFGKKHRHSNWATNWFQLCLFSILGFSVFFISACSEQTTYQSYFNPETGILLERPGNWDVVFYERNWMIILETKRDILSKNSARIEILGGSCPSTPADLTYSPLLLSEILEDDIKRIGQLYNQQVVQIVQEPTIVENRKYNVLKVVIQIPTTSMDDPIRIQVGEPEPGKFQKIRIYEIQDRKFHNNTIEASIYEGNSTELNNQAQKIVNSIQRVCKP